MIGDILHHRGATDLALERVHDYAILGWGIDIAQNQPVQKIVEFTYDKQQVFDLYKRVLIPDQFAPDPTPRHDLKELRTSDVMQSAREYQSHLSTEFGLGGTAEGVEFSTEADVTNDQFRSTNRKTVHQYVSVASEYEFLRLDGVGLQDGILPEVVNAARFALRGSGSFTDFFMTFGTHILKSASLGGQIKTETTLVLDATSARIVASTGVDTRIEAKNEALGYFSNEISFDTRSSVSDTTYRTHSTVNVALEGGNPAARDFDAWQDSLEDSDIPTTQMTTDAPLLAGRHYLALVRRRYVPLHTLLGLSREDTNRFNNALRTYLGGHNPFDDTVHRLNPEVPESDALREGETRRFHIKAVSNYTTYAGLEARPGAYALVKHRPSSHSYWTEKRVYAGETIILHKKDWYVGDHIDVKFTYLSGDDPMAPDVRVHVRNRRVR